MCQTRNLSSDVLYDNKDINLQLQEIIHNQTSQIPAISRDDNSLNNDINTVIFDFFFQMEELRLALKNIIANCCSGLYRIIFKFIQNLQTNNLKHLLVIFDLMMVSFRHPEKSFLTSYFIIHVYPRHIQTSLSSFMLPRSDGKACFSEIK